MANAGYGVSDAKSAFAEEGIALLAREDVDRRRSAIESPTILFSMTPRVTVAICDTAAMAERFTLTTVWILGRADGTKERAKAAVSNVAVFYPVHDAATGTRIHQALDRLTHRRFAAP